MSELARAARTAVASLAYRARKCLDEAPERFGSFGPGAGARTVDEILDHMSDLLDGSRKRIDPVGYAEWNEAAASPPVGSSGRSYVGGDVGPESGPNVGPDTGPEAGPDGGAEEPERWDARERFEASVALLDRCLDRNPDFGQETHPYRLLQGPLADALTHVGQLAMLRRLAGAPVAAESYYRADMGRGALESQ